MYVSLFGKKTLKLRIFQEFDLQAIMVLVTYKREFFKWLGKIFGGPVRFGSYPYDFLK